MYVPRRLTAVCVLAPWGATQSWTCTSGTRAATRTRRPRRTSRRSRSCRLCSCVSSREGSGPTMTRRVALCRACLASARCACLPACAAAGYEGLTTWVRVCVHCRALQMAGIVAFRPNPGRFGRGGGVVPMQAAALGGTGGAGSHRNFSHQIRQLNMGPLFPGAVNPLDGVKKGFEEAGALPPRRWARPVGRAARAMR